MFFLLMMSALRTHFNPGPEILVARITWGRVLRDANQFPIIVSVLPKVFLLGGMAYISAVSKKLMPRSRA